MPALSRTVNHQQLTVNSKVKRAFTLIELLVVISIIGILATFLVASFGSAQAKGRDARRKSDLDAIKKALELFKSDTTGSAFYPQAMGAAGATLTTPGYIKVFPADPSSPTASPTYYTYTSSGGICTAGNNLITNANCDTYTLDACLENVNDPGRLLPEVTCTPVGGAASAGRIYRVTAP